jgi:hypothetical protein
MRYKEDSYLSIIKKLRRAYYERQYLDPFNRRGTKIWQDISFKRCLEFEKSPLIESLDKCRSFYNSNKEKDTDPIFRKLPLDERRKNCPSKHSKK